MRGIADSIARAVTVTLLLLRRRRIVSERRVEPVGAVFVAATCATHINSQNVNVQCENNWLNAI